MDEPSIPALAVIAMAGRFPGGDGLGDFWTLLEQGRSAVRSLSDQELREAGVDAARLSDPSYVKCCVPLAGVDLFDAAFFGYSPRQAANIDPQQRLFLECAWEALERAGYGSIPAGVTAGVFGGSGYNGYLARSLVEDRRTDPENAFQSVTDADKDFMAGRVAYKLGLTGPAISVQTACSTSLVAVHLACQSLLSYECDIALAGGSSVPIPPYTGYLHREGSIYSRDGACRAFEADASGTIFGSGAAVLALRRLADAQADGDPVLAILRSTVVNNDGSRKVGFTAPGLDAQVRLLRTALKLAGLSPADIDYVESHGTATALGDSIELTALQEVYSSRRNKRKACVLGSVKTNIGHADTAAGVAGLIKTVLSLQHKCYLPNAGFRRPNAMLASPECVFRICSTPEPWPAEASRPRRAAVSSFGVGGTNAHAIVEEAPEAPLRALDQQAQLLPISARTQSALELACENLASHLDAHDLPAQDVAFTLQVGRRTFDHRRFVVGTDRREIAAALRTPAKRQHAVTESSRRPVVFLFPGQGAQWLGMLADLCETDRELSHDVALCARKVLDLQGHDLLDVLCRRSGTAALDINDTSVTQPALFVAEYCLARFWMRQGVVPAAVLGHSVGEYAAACIAGVLGFDDALRLVVHRARMSRDLPDGVMVAINLPEEEVEPLLTTSVSITAVNASRQCVVSGVVGAMQVFMAGLDACGIEYQRLAVSKPFHTPAAAPLAESMLRVARQSSLSVPRIPWISSVTAARISDAESRTPEYWARHVMKPVRFAAAMQALGAWENCALLEVGPGRVLTGLARRELGSTSLFVSLPVNARATRADLLATLGELWLAGAAIDFAAQARQGRRRVELPPHPMERSSYLKGSRAAAEPQSQRASTARLAPEHWFNLPSWKRSLFPAPVSYDAAAGAWLLLADRGGFAESLARKLKAAGQDVTLSVDEPEHFAEVFARLDRDGRHVGRIVHCATLSGSGEESFGGTLSPPQSATSLSQIARAVSARTRSQPLSLLVITNQLHDISGYEHPHPSKAALPVFCRCIAQELPNTRCVIVDLPPPKKGQRSATQYARYENSVLAEIENSGEPTVAYRQDWRFVQTYSAVELASGGPAWRDLKRGGLYVLTGGSGHLGRALGDRLVRECEAKLLLITRGTSSGAAGSEAQGSDVIVASADVSNAAALSDAISRAERQFGPVRGVFHLAADFKHRSIRRRMAELDARDLEAQARPKTGGLLALIEALGSRPIDFGVVFSSSSAVLGGVGYGAYAAANAVMDSMISSRADARLMPWMSLNWDTWLTPGVVADPHAIGMEEGLDALWRACRFGNVPQLVISSTPLEPRLDTWVRGKRAVQTAQPVPISQRVPDTGAVTKVLPRSALERQIAGIWQELLGIEAVGVTESFLDLGGDSLIGVRVISRIKESFRVSLTPASLLGQNSTVEELSRDIVRAMAQTRFCASVHAVS